MRRTSKEGGWFPTPRGARGAEDPGVEADARQRGPVQSRAQTERAGKEEADSCPKTGAIGEHQESSGRPGEGLRSPERIEWRHDTRFVITIAAATGAIPTTVRQSERACGSASPTGSGVARSTTASASETPSALSGPRWTGLSSRARAT